jgi:hypothetical protein
MESLDNFKCVFVNGIILDYVISTQTWSVDNSTEHSTSSIEESKIHALSCLAKCQDMERLVSSSSQQTDFFPAILGKSIKKYNSTKKVLIFLRAINVALTPPSKGSVETSPNYLSSGSSASSYRSPSSRSSNLSMRDLSMGSNNSSSGFSAEKHIFSPGVGWQTLKPSGEIIIMYFTGTKNNNRKMFT